MPDFTLSCPDCGGAISHSCGATGGAIQTQLVAQSGANGKIAHDSKVLDLEASTKARRAYNQGYNAQFLTFWEAYPLHRDKRKAEKAWRNAVARVGATTGATPTATQAQILAGAIRYREDPNRLAEFTKYAEGWLNGDGWEDEPLPPRLGNVKPSRPVAYHQPFCPECREAHPPGEHLEQA